MGLGGLLIFLTSALLLLLSAAAARRIGFVDRPTARKQHGVAVPITGGLAVVAGSTGALLFVQANAHWFGAFAIAGAFYLLGLWDDLFGIGARTRLLLQCVAAGLLVLSGFEVQSLGALGPLGPIAGPLFTGFCIVTCLNAANMVDGADGLLGSALAPALMGLALTDQSPAGDLAFGTLASVLAFLGVSNWPGSVAAPPRPYRAFLGNGGTNFLAILFCAFLLDGVDSGHLSPGAAPLLALLPLTEITFTFARRLAQRQSPFVADRGHLHHMALSAGWSPRRTAATYLLICLCSTATGLLMGARSDGLLWTLAAVALSLAAATGVLVGRSHGFPVLAKEMRP